MKILKSKKALSPVVASIILIAVTVAVSIAVAAWMASLAGRQMTTEEMSFISYQWASPSNTTVDWIVLTVKNTGPSDLSISEVRIDGVSCTTNSMTVGGVSKPYPVPLAKGESAVMNITRTNGFTRGIPYEFTVHTSRGNSFGPYTRTTP